ncbi:MAG: TonB-dependent receptor [Rikenellaceae bacterium]
MKQSSTCKWKTLYGERILFLFKKFFISILFIVFGNNLGQASDIENLRGKIIDSEGIAVPGAIIKVLNTNIFTLSDIDGNFSLKNISQGSILEISYLGYKTQKYIISNENVVTIVLTEDQNLLEEIVVVGYGTQKKTNLSGAVENISGNYMENRPVANLSRGIQGLIPNLNITMYDGNPSRSPTYNVRGITSIGSGGSALILIDGVEGDPNMINANDIESITVLKDASSSAIYGARGCYGVVLITTKNPVKGKEVSVTYSGNYSINQRTIIPDLITDGYIWASHFNEAHKQWYGQNPTAINSAFPFSQEYLAELKKRNDNPSLSRIDINPASGRYIYYDSHDWLKDLYNDYNNGTEHNIRVSKADEKTTFYLSGKFFEQDGIYRYNSDKYSTTNLRGKGSVKVNDWLEISNNFDFSSMEYNEPLYYGGWGFTSEISMGWSMRAFPVSPMLNPNGTITEMGARSIGDLYYGKNKAKTDRTVIKNTIGFSSNIFDGALSIKGDYTFGKTSVKKTRTYSAVPYENIPGVTTWLGTSMYFNHRTDIHYNAFNLYTELNKKIKDHTLKVLAGFNNENSSQNYLEVSRDGLLFPDRPSFSLSSGSNYSTIDKISEWNISGVFFRVNYDYKSRYLAEINGRYDGSSKFPVNQRWGFFPSLSAAWRISQESFWSVSPEKISQLKVRASYGSLGNGNIQPYLYLESMPVAISSRIINGVYPTMTNNPNVVPDGLTWEKATTLNAGIDLEMAKNRFQLTFDIYSRETTNMFTQGPTIPDVFGAPVPKGNYADLTTTGWELSLSWRDKTGGKKPLSYGIRVILADNKSEITKYYNPTKNLSDYYEGMVLGEIWGYVTEGLFKDQNDIDTHVNQSKFKSNNAGIIMPGDIKFKNLNGDNEISYGGNTVDNPGDRKIIGNSLPRYTYGINLDFDWNNFSLNMFLQGVGKRDWYPPSESYYFWGQYNRPYSPLPTTMVNNYYNSNPDNPNPNAYFPRYSGLLAYTSSGSLYQTQTRYLQDVSYLRLKNLTFSYNLPKNAVRKIGADNITIFFTGQNLLTFSKLFKNTKNIDPETIETTNPDTGNNAFGGGNGYPMLKTYTFGVNLNF